MSMASEIMKLLALQNFEFFFECPYFSLGSPFLITVTCLTQPCCCFVFPALFELESTGQLAAESCVQGESGFKGARLSLFVQAQCFRAFLPDAGHLRFHEELLVFKVLLTETRPFLHELQFLSEVTPQPELFPSSGIGEPLCHSEKVKKAVFGENELAPGGANPLFSLRF